MYQHVMNFSIGYTGGSHYCEVYSYSEPKYVLYCDEHNQDIEYDHESYIHELKSHKGYIEWYRMGYITGKEYEGTSYLTKEEADEIIKLSESEPIPGYIAENHYSCHDPVCRVAFETSRKYFGNEQDISRGQKYNPKQIINRLTHRLYREPFPCCSDYPTKPTSVFIQQKYYKEIFMKGNL